MADNDCFLCEFIIQNYDDGFCGGRCPYHLKYGNGNGCMEEGSVFLKWDDAKTPKTKKKYAQKFLEQLKEILKDMK